jgi:hypothetical protein
MRSLLLFCLAQGWRRLFWIKLPEGRTAIVCKVDSATVSLLKAGGLYLHSNRVPSKVPFIV